MPFLKLYFRRGLLETVKMFECADGTDSDGRVDAKK